MRERGRAAASCEGADRFGAGLNWSETRVRNHELVVPTSRGCFVMPACPRVCVLRLAHLGAHMRILAARVRVRMRAPEGQLQQVVQLHGGRVLRASRARGRVCAWARASPSTTTHTHSQSPGMRVRDGPGTTAGHTASMRMRVRVHMRVARHAGGPAAVPGSAGSPATAPRPSPRARRIRRTTMTSCTARENA